MRRSGAVHAPSGKHPQSSSTYEAGRNFLVFHTFFLILISISLNDKMSLPRLLTLPYHTDKEGRVRLRQRAGEGPIVHSRRAGTYFA